MSDYVKHDPNLPKLSPMYTCLWTLISPALEYDPYSYQGDNPVIVLSSRVAIFNRHDGEGEWIHLCTPKKLYNQFKRHCDYDALFPDPVHLPLVAEAYVSKIPLPPNKILRFFINSAEPIIPSIMSDITKACAVNNAHDVECWSCGAFLTQTEKLMVNLHYIGTKV